MITPDSKNVFYSNFRKKKVQELYFTYFRSELVDINLRDRKLDQIFLKLQILR